MTRAAHYPGKPLPTPARRLGRGVASLAWIPAAVLGAALLAACGGGGKTVRADAPPPSHRDWGTQAPANPAAANSVLMRAISLVGTPYRYGGNTPDTGFDCSGLIHYVYRDMLDLSLPRTTRGLAAIQGPRIAPERLSPGDLVFFGSRDSVTHAGIYVGEGRFVHAPSSGGTVRLDHLDGHYWRDHYSGARRVL